MSKIRSFVRDHAESISYVEFMARHTNEQSAADFLFQRVDFEGSLTPLSQILTGHLRLRSLPPGMQQLKHHPFFRLLAAAARENCPEAYNTLLYLWLCRMGVRPPEGVFAEPCGKSGRPRDRRTLNTYKKWLEVGCPPLGRRTLAFAIYGSEFTKASSANRKKMVDRCRRAVERCQTQLRPNPEPIKS